jgi:hypothetical protein
VTRVLRPESIREAWPVVRAWVEAGKFDLLHTLRFRGRRAFGLRPSFVTHRLGQKIIGVSIGLLAAAARRRIKLAAQAMPDVRPVVLNGNTASRWVTPPLIVESDDIEAIASLSKASGILDEPRCVAEMECWLPVARAEKDIEPHRPEGHRLARYYDPETSLPSAVRPSGPFVISHWQREQKASYYVIEQTAGPVTWTYSRELAFRAAFAARGLRAFSVDGSAIEASRAEAHLPLAAARLGVFTSGMSPGPVEIPGVRYRNIFPSSKVASHVLESLAVPSRKVRDH